MADQGSAREEAERLVAMALAAAQAALSVGRGRHFATGSAECCVCPVCRLVAAARDPDPEFIERLAAGAGDLAEGVVSLLRSFSTPGATNADPSGTTASDATASDTDRAGTTPSPRTGWQPDEPGLGDGVGPAEPSDVWAAATRSPARDSGSAAATAEPELHNRGERQR